MADKTHFLPEQRELLGAPPSVCYEIVLEGGWIGLKPRIGAETGVTAAKMTRNQFSGFSESLWGILNRGLPNWIYKRQINVLSVVQIIPDK